VVSDAKHHADLQPDLVDENDHAVDLKSMPSAAQCHAHQPGLEAEVNSHFAFKLCLGRLPRIDEDFNGLERTSVSRFQALLAFGYK
jgi:hypothetical protein